MSSRATRVHSREPRHASRGREMGGARPGHRLVPLGNRATLRALGMPTSAVVQRKACSCDGESGDRCAGCAAAGPVQRRAAGPEPDAAGVTGAVGSGLASPSRPLDDDVRSELEPRFGHDLSSVRLHTGAQAAASARVLGALAYTVGRDIVFASGRHAPHSAAGRELLAHELAHVVQQSTAAGAIVTSPSGIVPASGVHERQADAAARTALAGGRVPGLAPTPPAVQRRAAPYIKKVRVILAPPQGAQLEWEGEPPAEATGSDAFTVSTGKGYSDVGDPPGTCTRLCCKDADTQCAPPWNQPGKVGACCTYIGSTYWTGVPREEHNGWKWWTPIQPYYGARGIALHEHPEVTGRPIGHGCVRMDEPNAKRIYDYSNGKRTNVTIVGRAAPVACAEDRQCDPPATDSGAGLGRPDDGTRTAAATPPVPGLEGRMS